MVGIMDTIFQCESSVATVCELNATLALEVSEAE